MTTHDEQVDTTTQARADQQPSAPSDPDASATQPAPNTATDESTPPSSSAEAETSTDMKLFAGGDLSSLRSRWDDVQASFVDDPKDCVQKADALVADVVQQLTAGFSEARARLESQWARGEDASTEDLRQALKRYRAFFERLLAA